MLRIGDKELTIGECLIREVTGKRCPTCGMTRSFISMSKFQFEKAYTYNHGGPVIYIAGWSLMIAMASLWRGKKQLSKLLLWLSILLVGIGALFFTTMALADTWIN